MNKVIKNSLILLGIILFAEQAFAQNQKKVDSLQKVLNNAKEDTTRLSIYLALCDACDVNDNLKYGEPAVELADKMLYQTSVKKKRQDILKQKANALMFIGVYYGETKVHNIKKDLEYLNESLQIHEDIGDTLGTIVALGAISHVAVDYGLLSNSLDCDLKALALSERIHDNNNISLYLLAIGEIYDRQGNHVKAIEYSFKALDEVKKTNNKDNAIPRCYLQIAKFYDNNGDDSNAVVYGTKALGYVTGKGDSVAIAAVLQSIGNFYIDEKNYSKGMEYILKYTAICEKMKYTNGIGYGYGRIAKIDREQNNYQQALMYYLKSLNIFKGTGNMDKVYYTYSRIGEMFGKWYKNYKLAKVYFDSAIDGAKKTTDISTIAR